MSTNILFDKYEAVLLLAVCLWTAEYSVPTNMAAHILSMILRELAKNRSFEFDSSFRSVSGLLYQMRVMHTELSKKYDETEPKSIIGKVAKTYSHDKNEYERLLSEALIMSAESKNKQAFLKYITKQKSSVASDIYLVLVSVESIAQKKGLISGSLYDDLNERLLTRIENSVMIDRFYTNNDRKTKETIKIAFTLLHSFASSDMYDANNSGTRSIQDTSKIISHSTNSSSSKSTYNTTSNDVKNSIVTINPDKHFVSSDSIPISFVYYSREITGLLSWPDMYTRFLRLLWNEKSRILSGYIGRSFVESNGAADLCMEKDRNKMNCSVRIADDVFLETALTPVEILSRIDSIMNKCAIPIKRLSITYKVNIETSVPPETPKSPQKIENAENTSAKETPDNNVAEKLPAGCFFVDLNNTVDITYSKPLFYKLNGKMVHALGDWTDQYVKFFTELWSKYKGILYGYIGKSFTNANRADLRLWEDNSLMMAPKSVDYNISIETNLSTNDIVCNIKALLRICGLSIADLTIAYTKIESENIPEEESDHQQPTQGEAEEKKPSSNQKKLDHEFLVWLKEESGIAQKNIFSYYYYTKQCEEYCEKHKLNNTCLLSTNSYAEAMKTTNMLLWDNGFNAMSSSDHYRHMKALRWFKQFLESRIGSVAAPTSDKNQEVIERCLVVLQESFTNGLSEGLKKEDGSYSIKGNRFIRAYSEKYSEEFPQNVDIDHIFQKHALIYEGKYYALTEECKKAVQEIISENFDCIIFYYEMLYSAYTDILAQYNIHSTEMFKTVLKRVFPKYDYKKTYFTMDQGINDEKAVFMAFADDSILTLDELKKRLPYINVENMRYALRGSVYINLGNLNYAVLDRLDLSEEDAKDSESMIKAAIALEGYCMMKKLFSERSEIANPSVSPDALKEAIFKKYLSDKYSKKYSLIGPLGSSMSISDVLQQYCYDHMEITLEDVENYERELTGEEPKYSIWAALDSMVRVSEDKFVRRDMIVFDAEDIDSLIEEYFGEKRIISFANIKSFGLFPYVMGYSWNRYLLEGFLIHCSKKWGCTQSNPNKNELIGAIYSRNMNCDYDELLAIAVADSGIALNDNNVSDFLLNNQFRRRKPNEDKMDALINRANEIRLKEGG